MKFKYGLNGEIKFLDFEVLFDTDGVVHVGKNILCDVLDISPKKQFHRPSWVTAPPQGGKATPYFTLDTVFQLLDDLSSPNSASKLKPITKEVLPQFRTHFLDFIRQQLNPTGYVAPEQVSFAVPMFGEAALRHDLAIMGATPSEINYYTSSGMTQTIENKKTFPTSISKNKDVRIYDAMTEKRFDVSTYKQGSLQRNNAQLLSQFEKVNPNHKLSARRMSDITHEITSDGKDIVKIEPRLETQPWDGEVSFFSKGKKATDLTLTVEEFRKLNNPEA